MRFEHLQNQTLCTCAQHSSSSNRSPRSLFWTCFYPKLVHKVVLYYSKYSSVVGIMLLWTPDPLRNWNVFFFKNPNLIHFLVCITIDIFYNIGTNNSVHCTERLTIDFHIIKEEWILGGFQVIF